MPAKTGPGGRYPVLAAPGFGTVCVDAGERTRDFYVRADGKLKDRNKKRAKRVYGSSHVLGPEELQAICKHDPKVLIVASGYSGVLHIAHDGEQFLRERGIQFEVLSTPDAVRRYAATPGRKAILVHVTC